METLFDAAYLFTIIFLGITIIKKSQGTKQYLLFGIMAVVLGAGDAFHLVPRAISALTTGPEAHAAALGIGKLITSITMTVFYLLLYFVWRLRYNVKEQNSLTLWMGSLAVLRVALCLFPQNQWISLHPPLLFGILRNIPFALMGLTVILLFAKSVRETGDTPFRFMALTITLSFLFYIPVVLLADAYPLVGMLMIPKTLAYVWSVWIGYAAMARKDAAKRV